MKPQISPKDWQRLSAYLDRELSPRELEQVEQQISARPEMQSALRQMEQNRAMMRSLPRHRVPHNFTLTPEMVGQTRRPAQQWRLWPALSFSSALATLLVVATFLFQMLPGAAPVMQSAEAPMAAMESAEMAGGAQMDSATRAMGQPNVIYWGGLPVVPYANGLGGGGDGLGGGAGDPSYTQSLPNLFNSPEAIMKAPEMGLTAPEEQPAAPVPTPAPMPSFDGAPIEGTGPILGVPSADQAGMPAESPYIEAAPVLEEPVANRVDYTLIQAGLAAIAVITGLAAFLLYRRSLS